MYFNKRGPKDHLPWSVDLGAQNSEIQVLQIILDCPAGESKFDPNERRPEVPKAWFEFPDATVTISGGIATIHGSHDGQADEVSI